MLIKDMLGRELNLNRIPQRIVSLVPSQTELLVDLGLENSLVGVTKFCVHPSYLGKSKKVVGGTKKVHYDKIKVLEPDIILCNKEENTPEMVTELQKIAPVHVSEIIYFEDVLRLIGDYGNIFDRKEKSELLQQKIRSKKEHFRPSSVKAVRVAYMIWRNPWMAVGGNTFINSILKMNGCVNIFEEKEGRYPEIDLRELSKLKPDLILLSSEPFPFKKKHFREIEEFSSAPVIIVNGEYFSWYGSRLLKAFDYFGEFQKLVSTSL